MHQTEIPMENQSEKLQEFLSHLSEDKRAAVLELIEELGLEVSDEPIDPID